MSKILAVDLGNYNINTSEGKMFIATFREGLPDNPQGEDIITINERNYCMAKESSFDFEFNKNKKNYMPNLLYAIEKSLKGDAKNINLVLGVPVENFGVGNDFKKDLEDKEFEYSFNNNKRTVKINKVAVVGEAISSFYVLPPEERSGDVMIIDIGGRTINVVTFRNGKIEHKKQINTGMLDFYDKVKSRHNSINGTNLETEQMFSYIKKKMVKVDHEDEILFLKDAFNRIKQVADINFYKLFFTGGGSITLEDSIKELEPRANIMDNALFTNVNGNKAIAEAQWGEE